MSQEKMNVLCSYEGISSESMGDLIMDSVNPGICMNPDCDYTIEVEPDQNEGWCEECNSNTVKSFSELVLEGFEPPD